MSGYINSPVGPAAAITHYVNNPTSNLTPVARYVNSPGSSVVPPGTPFLWFDGQDINLLGNAGILDADPVGTWKNKGSLGSAGDIVQGTAGTRPIFRKIAAAGKINNLSAVEGDGTRFINGSAFTALVQPVLLAVVFKVTDLTVTHTVFDGGGATSNLSIISGTGAVQLFSGAAGLPGQTIPAATWETCVALFSGAASWSRLNGAQSANINAGTNQSTSASLFDIASGTIMKGMIEEFLLWNGGTLPSGADIEAYLNAKTGVTPQ